MSYAWYKFHKAVRSLAFARTQKKAWLASDYVTRILLLQAQDLPEPIRPEFQRFQRDMTMIQGQNVEGSLRATVKAMSEAEVIKMILRLISLHDVLKLQMDPLDMLQNRVPANGDIRNQAA